MTQPALALPAVPAARRYRCEAAVLVALSPEGSVLLGLRNPRLRRHGGEVAFPGGRRERGESPWQAALRESREELGLGQRRVHRLGYLPPRVTRHGIALCPCVGRLDEAFVPRPDGSEMVAGFWVPLAFLAEPSQQRQQRVYYRGLWRTLVYYEWQGRRIWGVTAQVLADLAGAWMAGHTEGAGDDLPVG